MYESSHYQTTTKNIATYRNWSIMSITRALAIQKYTERFVSAQYARVRTSETDKEKKVFLPREITQWTGLNLDFEIF